MPRLVGINHVALEVGDLEAALDWYGRILEFEVVREPDFPHMAFLQMGTSSSISRKAARSRRTPSVTSGS